MLERSPQVKRTVPLRRSLATLLTLPLCAGGLLTLAAPAHAAAPAGPTASVTLGDSYISGEAGRWKGNSDDTSGSRDGTDRAWNGSGYAPAGIYGSTYASGCDRSDVAEVKSATGIAQTSVNLACSGATTANVFRAADGGQSFKGEAPQADQLAALAAKDNVKLITLSIGGNDLGFSDVITDCAEDYAIWDSYCADTEQSAIDGKMPAAMAGVGKAIDEIRAAMAGDGYASGSYRIVLQSYPSPIPRSGENRYSESGWDRVNTGGCPFWDADSDWARDTMVPEVSDQLAAVAAAKGVQFLDLRDFLQGREVCSTATRLATPGTPPSATTSEWARFVDVGTTTQGTTQESMHPNYYAQQALGRCLTLLWARTSGDFACRNTPGQDASGMYLSATS
ncbi:GDSL-type esterase/lipase family protein [Kitasatospora sp. NBC_01287]|uniref:GDSL-type esterase/lipase family protein n=1 Tax=Kitasatospora sp. NBC_01287 TaxID=2903573 RepID=UPI00225B11FC|nr:GDSL-type esterase/lipase family protein [Kitasatospora sp. NBC_01287]MCX4750804.1 GDSL-type esterase/lipase family protein [Kitasatospora sp. NBC_01287]